MYLRVVPRTYLPPFVSEEELEYLVDWAGDVAEGEVAFPQVPAEEHVSYEGAVPVASAVVLVNLLDHIVHDQPGPHVQVSGGDMRIHVYNFILLQNCQPINN